MVRGKVRKTRVTREQIEQAKQERKKKGDKRNASPGPWSDKQPPFEVNAMLRLNEALIGQCYGAYLRHSPLLCEKGWYPILFNLTSENIKQDVEKYGLDNYIAACEKSLNDQKIYGTVIILQVTTDHSLQEDQDSRFISCYAKTNKFGIKGFSATRKGIYQIL